MSPAEFVKMATKLKELGATRVSVTADGAFDVAFQGPPRLVAMPTAQEPRERERTVEEIPERGEARQAYRESILRTVTGG